MTAGFWYAWSFLTRFPAPRARLAESAAARALVYFPWIGALLGALGALVLLVCSALWGPVLGAVLALAAYCWFTGGLHLDGWADTVDGWSASHADPKRGLEVMQDSRIGAHGATALVLLLLIKSTALHALALTSTVVAVGAWVMAASVARCAAAWAVRSFESARSSGWGASLRAATERQSLLALVPCPLFIIFGWWQFASAVHVAWALLALAVVAGLVRALAARWARLWGGLTGDHYGALIELGEAACLVTWCGYE